MVVHRRRRAGRHDQRKQTELSGLIAVQRVLADATTHPARRVRLRKLIRQPAVRREQPRKTPDAALDAGGMVANRARQPPRLINHVRISGTSTMKPKSAECW